MDAAPAASETGLPPAAQPVTPRVPSRAAVAPQRVTAVERNPPRRTPTRSPQDPQGDLPGRGAAAPPAGWMQAEEDFGRWERSTRQCEIQRPNPQDGELMQPASAPEQLGCRSVRLDQQLAGLLSIRFLPRSRDREAQQLLFAGVLRPGSQPMRCQDRRCQPQWPIQVQLSAMATSNMRTLGLPQARVIQGNCSLDQDRVLCTARDRDGRRWEARGRW